MRLGSLITCVFISYLSYAQVGIGTASPDPAAVLDINSQLSTTTYGGLKLPQVNAAQRATISNPVPDGMMIYYSDVDKRCVQLYDSLSASWVDFYCMNRAPVAANVIINGVFQEGSTLTTTYDENSTAFQTDAENDAPSTPLYQWYRAATATSTGAPITGAIESTYTLTTADVGSYIALGITPNALTGASPGQEVLSNYGGVVTAAPAVTELFISEYIEGSSNNKYLEIANFTGAPIDLSSYRLSLYSNGNSSASATLDLTGILASGSVVVFKNSSATIYTGPAITTAVCTFNGDDAITLENNGTVVDIIGTVGTRANYGTNETLIKKPGVGPNSTFDKSGDWNSNAQDFQDLGDHDF